MAIIERHTGELAGLKYRYQIASDDAPLAILVHGRAGDSSVMWTFARCLSPDWNIVAPQAPLADPIGGHSWWDLSASDRGAAVRAAREAILTFLRALSKQHDLRPRLRLAMGFSQGGALLSSCVQHDPAFVEGLALLASFVPEEVEHIEKGVQLPRVFMAHGEADDKVPLERALRGRDFLQGLGMQVELSLDPVGHKVGSQGMRDLKSWCSALLLAASKNLS